MPQPAERFAHALKSLSIDLATWQQDDPTDYDNFIRAAESGDGNKACNAMEDAMRKGPSSGLTAQACADIDSQLQQYVNGDNPMGLGTPTRDVGVIDKVDYQRMAAIISGSSSGSSFIANGKITTQIDRDNFWHGVGTVLGSFF